MPVPGDTFARELGGILQLVVSVIVAVLVGKLAVAGLARTYWPLVLWLILDSIEAILRLVLSNLDVPIYQLGQGLKLALATLILWRLCGLVFVNYPAIGSFAARAVRIVIPVCIGLGIASYLTEGDPPAGRSPNLQLTVAVERAVTTAILTFLLALGVFAGWFPLRMKRNIGRLLIGLMVLYASGWIYMLLANVDPASIRWVNIGYSVVALCVASYWLVTWGPAGEVESAPNPAWNPARLAEMTGQLEQMQAQLSRRGYQ